MHYEARRPLTILGKTYRAGETIKATAIPARSVQTMLAMHRIVVKDADIMETTVAETPQHRGRPPKAARAAEGA